ncbi:hypothetical protein CGCSCA5_v004335 [Colletotrichum siamense]|nr:hypothetical protein CGCSCA5_v004335 [Colletotrichum siamense]
MLSIKRVVGFATWKDMDVVIVFNALEVLLTAPSCPLSSISPFCTNCEPHVLAAINTYRCIRQKPGALLGSIATSIEQLIHPESSVTSRARYLRLSRPIARCVTTGRLLRAQSSVKVTTTTDYKHLYWYQTGCPRASSTQRSASPPTRNKVPFSRLRVADST